MTFPAIFPPRFINDAVFEMRDEIVWRVVGGTMSTRAARRSKSVSSAETSEETDEREAEDDVRDEEVDAYGDELGFASLSVTISILTMMTVVVAVVDELNFQQCDVYVTAPIRL